MALTKDRLIKRREGESFRDPVAAGVIIFAGAAIFIGSDGFARPAGAVAATRFARGVAQETVDNSNGNDGDAFVNSKKGIYNFKNDTVAPVTRGIIGGASIWFVDDETVSTDDDSNQRVIAGALLDIDDDGIWVKVGTYIG